MCQFFAIQPIDGCTIFVLINSQDILGFKVTNQFSTLSCNDNLRTLLCRHLNQTRKFFDSHRMQTKLWLINDDNPW